MVNQEQENQGTASSILKEELQNTERSSIPPCKKCPPPARAHKLPTPEAIWRCPGHGQSSWWLLCSSTCDHTGFHSVVPLLWNCASIRQRKSLHTACEFQGGCFLLTSRSMSLLATQGTKVWHTPAPRNVIRDVSHRETHHWEMLFSSLPQ